MQAYTEVVTAPSSNECGIEFVRGQTMVVFARYGGDAVTVVAPDQLTVNLCDGTRALDATPLELSDAGYAPVAGPSTRAEPAFPMLGWLCFVAVAGLGAMPISGR